METRAYIGAKVRELRSGRRWTQAELASRLGLSQARLSEIERGQGSFSAEQLLEIFRLFNVGPSDFDPTPSRTSQEDRLWNAAARLGARHLVESEQVLPSQRVQTVHDVLREALADAGSSRLLTALAAVLVARVDELRLSVVEEQLARLGLSHRLAWLVDNTCAALGLLVRRAPDASRLHYGRVGLVLQSWLRAKRKLPVPKAGDILDHDIRSEKTLAAAEASRSDISRKWGIVSELTPEDFARALEAAHETT